MKTKIYHSIGIMSGTSKDGIDVAYCRFEKKDEKWHYEIVCAETFPYSQEWTKRLTSIETGTALEYAQIHVDYGHLLGKTVRVFIDKYGIHPDYIASHGHTIFHQPQNKLSAQIGDGAAISARCKKPVVCDFRSTDIALGGQGAPLVPIGDKLLFSDYDACLNIGGISNVSYNADNKRIAFDVVVANMILNYFAQKKGMPFDENGLLARKGNIQKDLFDKLNELEYYSLSYPKSIGKEWVDDYIFPVINTDFYSIEDMLATMVEHIAFQINKVLSFEQIKTVLITGGGAKNVFLIERLKKIAVKTELIIPDKNLIDYKEALIFAFLGLLRIENENNCLSSVTGAQNDNCGGCVYWGSEKNGRE